MIRATGRVTVSKTRSSSAGAAKLPELPRSIATIAAQHLEREIIEGRLDPGERLIEEEWAEKFGISRGTFREVLRILEAFKLVEIIPRRGAQVASVNRRDVEEIYILRKHLFQLAYMYATPNLNDDALRQFQAIVDDMECVAERGDAVEFTALSQKFDELVLDVADIARLRMLIEFLGKQTIRYRYMGFKIAGRIERSLAAHKRILAAFKAGDGERAGAAVYEIIEWAGKSILSAAFGDGPAEPVIPENGRAREESERPPRPSRRKVG